MFKLGLTALLTAAVCVAVAAATGLGASSVKVIVMQKGPIYANLPGNFHCQLLTKTEEACGANAIKSSIQVYYGPHTLAVIKFDKTGKKFTQLFGIKR